MKEAVSGDEVSKSIEDRVGVLITYKGENNEHTGVRYIEPYVYGSTSKNNPAIRAYQYYGDTKTGVPRWKLLRLDRIESWQPTENKFEIEPQARGWAAQSFNGNDKSLPSIFKVVELGESPLTDLERLRARTKQLKQNKPVNINQLVQKEKPIQQNTLKPQNKQQKGPIGDNIPDNGYVNPETEVKTEPSTPLNNDGTPKTNTTQPPVKQEPQKNGPITGDPTNPEENKAEDLMSNDQFRDMIKRNLEITDKEKSKKANLQNNVG